MESAFGIIAEPNRRAILSLLASSERSVSELEQQLRMPQTSVSKHLRVLRSARLVRERREGRNRIYQLEPERIQDVANWAEEYRSFWETRSPA